MSRILLLPGDGIGPEVIAETRRVLGWFAQNRNMSFEIEEDLVGGVSYETLRHAGHRRDDGEGARRMRSCSARSAVPNGIRCRSRRSPSAGCCACAKTSSCSPICDPPCVSMR
jgi:hypothetical protein